MLAGSLLLTGCTGKGSIEFAGVVGIIAFLAFVPLKTIVLGVIVIIVGAFLPAAITAANAGRASISLGKGRSFSIAGTLRFVVVIAGLLIVLGSFYQGAENMSGSQPAQASAPIHK